MSKKTKFTIAMIALAALVLGGAAVAVNIIMSSKNETITTNSKLSEKDAWLSLGIECDNLNYSSCREEYEIVAAENAFRTGPEEDQMIIDYLMNVNKQPEKATDQEALNLAAGWPAEDGADLTVHFTKEQLEILRSKDLAYAFIGSPETSIDDQGEIPESFSNVTFIDKSGKIMGTEQFTYLFLGESIVGCAKECA